MTPCDLRPQPHAAMSARTTTAREIAVPLPGGLTLQLALTMDPDGTPGLLIVSTASAEIGWRARRDQLVLPGKALSETRAALEALEEAGR